MNSFRTYEGFVFSVDDYLEKGFWECHVLSIDEYSGYYRVLVDTDMNALEFLCGNYGCHWILFTNIGTGTILGSYNSFDYNYNKLEDILNHHDAFSIAQALNEIHDRIKSQKKEVDELPF